MGDFSSLQIGMHVHGGYGEVLVNGTESLCDPISFSGDGAGKY